jgi:hypothetical protein
MPRAQHANAGLERAARCWVTNMTNPATALTADNSRIQPATDRSTSERRAPRGPARAILLRAVEAYSARGWSLTPVLATTTKGAYLPSWPTLRLTLDQLRAELDRPSKGVGVLLGEPSGGLVDVDLDHAAAVEAADVILPRTALVSGRTRRPRTHRWFVAVGAPTLAHQARDTGMLVELRSTGGQTVLPPSPHPEGIYEWDTYGEPTRIDAAELVKLVGQVAAAAFLRVQGWDMAAAVAFARSPELARIAQWETNADCPNLRAWLGFNPLPLERRGAPISGGIDRAKASPHTLAILDRVGGVVGAARLLGLELREGHQACPWHSTRADSRALQVTGPLWRCHAGCGSGNAIHLAVLVLGLDYRAGREAIADRLGLDWRDAPAQRGVKQSARSDCGGGLL